MANKIITFLQEVGSKFEEGLAALAKVATIASPFVSALDPAAGAILNTTLGVVALEEQKYAAMGKQNGTGTQKLADVVTILTPLLTTSLSEAGQPATAAQITKYINDAVAILNDIPATVAT